MDDNPDTVLAVDDNPDVLLQIDHALRPDYRVCVANSAEGALEVLEQNPEIDLILLDVLMPGLDGFQTCRLIKKHPDWQRIPLLFLTALDQDRQEVMGLMLGAVDYLAKPIVPEVLRARVNTHLELARLRAQLQARIQELTEERALIEDILLRLHRDCSFDNRSLHQIMQPVERVSGDLCLADLTPDGRQWLLAGDFTGHGLIAAMAGPLVKQIFYDHCAFGVPFEQLIATLEQRLYDHLPRGRFMAAHVIEVAADRTQITWINAGMPDAFLVSPGGDIAVLRSQTLPFGIAVGQARAGIQVVAAPPGSHLLLCSDGVTEAASPSGEAFSSERLISAYRELLLVRNLKEGLALDALLQTIYAHRQQNTLEDDALILELAL
ncbi:SpoIIE family protein phosphatase [Caldichromatium japonicum]|uniref:SpoIIE family protein phosphatase n=1 Tax=Caldichromatium japonicum TaxID=2699430 RepID=A0A6G7VFJ3_9GAMM|nr:fused response regulator/phosphatase [Caldichromatium japonicum]QIK38646.1 SpoIIE family protein phosphatase [Caldichromatium japonicum]